LPISVTTTAVAEAPSAARAAVTITSAVNAHRMRNARFRELGMLVGSGLVEGGNQTDAA
jgi:hypothetical protein